MAGESITTSFSELLPYLRCGRLHGGAPAQCFCSDNLGRAGPAMARVPASPKGEAQASQAGSLMPTIPDHEDVP